MKDLAGEMLAIQAAREALQGHSFEPDVAWQREFEDAFIFEETPDQIKSIQETKTDMESLRPMDRRGRALWRAGPYHWGLTEGVNWRFAGETLRFHDRAGLVVR